MKKLSSAILLGLILFAPFSFFDHAQAQGQDVLIRLTPTTSRFVVDSTFEVSIYLDTKDVSINSVFLNLRFPPDKLQIVSSSAGKSIIGLWPTLPKYNNQTGTVELVGGIPGGIKVSQGLITTLTFRARAVGNAQVRIENARVLLHDGHGTETLVQTQGSLYEIILPPPAGPLVVSETHSDQTAWSNNPNVAFRWDGDGGYEGFSYMISDNTTDIPDDISEGPATDVVYRNLSNGRQYFHIKGLRNGQWGGVTHYALKIDTMAPAQFQPEIIPRNKTSRRKPVIEFQSSDVHSGISHYELRLVSLSNPSDSQSLFIEAFSPYVPSELEYGKYDVIVRAYDFAGNFTDATETIDIVPVYFRNMGDSGFEFRSTMVIGWPIVWTVLAILFLILFFIAYRIFRHHRLTHHRLVSGSLPDQFQQQLSELQEYRNRYGKIGIFFLMISASLVFSQFAFAQAVISPPTITMASKNISNQEIFYAGGEADVDDGDVILFIQNAETLETMQQDIEVMGNEWFYRHDNFFLPGRYIIWAQAKQGVQLSAPSPQVQIEVAKTAFQFGGTRLSYAAFNFAIIAFLLVTMFLMGLFVVYHLHRARRKQKLIISQINEAEASLKRGFAVLNRDIQSELEIIRQVKMSKALTTEEERREELLLRDLAQIEQYIAKEIWDIEEAERTGEVNR